MPRMIAAVQMIAAPLASEAGDENAFESDFRSLTKRVFHSGLFLAFSAAFAISRGEISPEEQSDSRDTRIRVSFSARTERKIHSGSSSEYFHSKLKRANLRCISLSQEYFYSFWLKHPSVWSQNPHEKNKVLGPRINLVVPARFNYELITWLLRPQTSNC